MGKPLSVEKEVLMEMRHSSEASKHKTSVSSTGEGGDIDNAESNTANPLYRAKETFII